MTPRFSIPSWLLAAFLLLDGIASVSIGAIRLAHGHYPSGSDIHLRWIEQRNVAHGRNPATVSDAAVPPYIQPLYIRNNALATSCYPPWAFTTQFLFVLPVSWTVERWYFLGWSLAALVLLSVWTHLQFRPYGDYPAAIGLLLPASLWSVSYCLSNGQYAIILTGLLAGAFLLLARGREGLAGVLVGIAFLKPTLVAPFLLIFLFQRRWKLLAVVAALNLVATLITWGLTHVDPVTLLHQSAEHIREFPVNSQNVVSLLVRATAGPNPTLDLVVMAAIGLIGAGAIFAAHRHGCRPATLAGIAAAIALSWTYRKEYDVVLILFLIVATAQVALETRRWLPWLALVLMGSTLLVPFRLEDHNRPWLQALELLSWIIAIAVCLGAADAGLAQTVRCSTRK